MCNQACSRAKGPGPSASRFHALGAPAFSEVTEHPAAAEAEADVPGCPYELSQPSLMTAVVANQPAPIVWRFFRRAGE